MIMVFGGTTEGRLVAGVLDRAGRRYLYSTKTSSGGFDMRYGEHRRGALDEASMRAVLSERRVSLVIDAAHPFAAGLHETIGFAAGSLGLPVVRYERDYTIPADTLSGADVEYAASFPSALEILEKRRPRRVMATTGVRTIGTLEPYWRSRDMMVRILPSGRSAAEALRQGFPKERLIVMHPPRTWEEEVQCMLTHDIDCLLCKENGASGFLPEKILAAKTRGAPVVVVRRPTLPASFTVVRTPAELDRAIDLFTEAS